MAKRGLGRGLSALIPGADREREKKITSKKNMIMELRLDDIFPNKNQPRSRFKDNTLDELAGSIKEFGVLQPIIVRKTGDEEKYEIIAGERRFRATKINGLDSIPALIVEDVDDTASLEMALIENIHRDNLSAMEQAYCYKQLIDEFKLTHQEMSKRIGKSRAVITNSLRLLTLPLEVQKFLDDNLINEGHARALLGIDSMEEQIKAAKKVAKTGMSVREVERLVDRQKHKNDVPDKRKTLQLSRLPQISEKLSRYLDAPVKISTGKKKGKVEIEFGTVASLEKIVEKIVG